MDRSYSQDPSGHVQGSYKRISQLRDIAVDNKNKNSIQLSLAYLINLEIYLNLSYEITYS